ncbi:MAG: NADAR family protein [Gemmatimonadota bacterium]
MAIHFLLPEGPHGFLSNWSPHPIALDGTPWPTVEHYFQAMKFPQDPALQGCIRQAATPEQAKALAWATAAVREDWRQVRDAVMRAALVAKYRQHADLRQRLLATGEIELVEANPEDGYWGDSGDGSGTNRAGQLLMEVRAELRAEL